VAGFQLWRVQLGLDPNDWKPIASVGAGVREIRVHARILYVAMFAEAVFVLHAFEKMCRKTPRRDIEIAARRLQSMLAERKDGS
jgi:phage-related protein